GVTFDSPDVFDSDIYSNLFLFLGRQQGGVEQSTEQVVNWDAPSTIVGGVVEFDQAEGVCTLENDLTGLFGVANFQATINSSDGVPYTVELRRDGEVIASGTGTNNKTINKLYAPGNTKGVYTIHVTASSSKVITGATFLINNFDSSFTWLDVDKTVDQNISRMVIISENIDTIKIRDFFSGLLRMHNLVIIPNSETEFYINTLDNWYAEGAEYDITKYINTDKEIPVKRGKVLNNISFSFKEPETLLELEYEKNFGKFYGDLEAEIRTDDGIKLDGESLSISLPFENMVYERLVDQDDDSLTEIMYGLIQDEKQEPTTIEWHMFYGNLITGLEPMSLVDASGDKNQFTGAWIPFHTNTTDTTTADYSTTWGADLSEYDSVSIDNNLYDVFYSDYNGDTFNVKRRVFNFEAKFPEHLLTQIKLNDKLIISGRAYKINQMNINLTSNITKLELINDL